MIKNTIVSAFLLTIFISTTFVSSGGFAAAKEADLSCETLHPLLNAFLSQHVLYKKLTPTLEEHTTTQFLKMLDPSKIYLMQSDVDKIKASLSGMFEKIEKKNCSPIDETHALYVKRVDEAAVYAKKLLGPDFKFQEKTTIVINPDKRVFAKNQKELQDLQSRYIQFQISNYMVSDMKVPEAKKQLIHRYDLNLKQAKDFKKYDLYSLFLDAFASSLDPHSNFLAKDYFEDFEIQMRLSLQGIGATLSSQDGYTVVENLVPGGAAAKSGLMEPKDKIIAVDTKNNGKMEPVVDMPLREVVKLIRGDKGTKVGLTILRSGKKASRVVITLTRAKIDLKDEAAKISYINKEVNGQKLLIGVIDLPSFYSDSDNGERSCSEDVKKLVKEANAKKVDGLVLDLSKNGGGVLGEAVKIVGLFIKKGNVVETQDSDSRVEVLADLDSQMLYSGPLVVLTSRLSASASEIVAGALRDYKRAVIIGSDHTFGKGTVQAVMRLREDMGALKVTTGMFFTPGGNSTQERGVDSDVIIPSQYVSKEFSEDALDYALPKKSLTSFLSDEANGKDGTDMYKPIQSLQISELQKASKLRTTGDKDFAKMIADFKETEDKNGVLNLSDVMKKTQETNKERDKKAKSHSLDGADPEYLKQAAVKEAVAIVADFVLIQKGQFKLATKVDNSGKDLKTVQ